MRSGSPMVAPSASLAPASASLAPVSTSMGGATSGDDIDGSFAFDHVKFLETQARIGCADAGEQFVFPTVPRADDMRVVVVVGLAEIRLIGTQQVDHLTLHDALAGRATLMQAMVAVGVIGAGVPVDPDLQTVLAHDPHIAILHFLVLAHENLRHSSHAPFRSAVGFHGCVCTISL